MSKKQILDLPWILGGIRRRMYRCWRWFRLRIFRNKYLRAQEKWLMDRGDETRRLEYPLSEKSIVMDVGGYRGDWAGHIVDRYNPRVLIFEPVREYYQMILDRFQGNSEVHVFHFGLADRSCSEQMVLLEDGSSIYRKGANTQTIRLEDGAAFIRNEGLKQIDLVKINIEGGEYCLLEHWLEENMIHCFQSLQIQFHRISRESVSRRKAIQEKLMRTHDLTWEYPFVWENWERRES